MIDLHEMPPRFHARHDAVSRAYFYQISTRKSALSKKFVWWVKEPLSLERMQEAAALLPGRHDFRLFCEKPGEQPSTVVVVESVELATPGALILVRLAASHFLWKMVRRLAGTLVEVGRGNRTIAEVSKLLAEKSREPARWTAPPSGLFLEKVRYTSRD